jgi:hypothetical protein
MPMEESTNRRRAGRIAHQARIILSGRDADGFSFAEETETLTISKYGLSVRTSYQLALGRELSVRTKDKNRVAQFQVVWVGEPTTPNEGRVGMEWMEPERFWGLKFPPDNWERD